MRAALLAVPALRLIEPKVFGSARCFRFKSLYQQACNAATDDQHIGL